jgi:hypothetical protein
LHCPLEGTSSLLPIAGLRGRCISLAGHMRALATPFAENKVNSAPQYRQLRGMRSHRYEHTKYGDAQKERKDGNHYPVSFDKFPNSDV